MQTKKQNPLLAGLFIFLALGFTVLMVISVIDLIDWFEFMTTTGIILNIAAIVGSVFVFCIPAYILGAYFIDMSKDRLVHAAIRYSVAGWFILFAEAVYSFIATLIDYGFVSNLLVSLLLLLLPLIFTALLYSKRNGYSSELNTAKIASVMYFLYLGLFYTIYDIATGSIGSDALSIITFIIRAILGLAISGAFCYYYFKLGNTSQPQQYGPQNNYGYGPQQPYGQQYGQQNGPLQQFRQQNGYAAPAAPVAPVPPVQQAPAAKFCTSCGSQVDPNAAFCNNCGNKL